MTVITWAVHTHHLTQAVAILIEQKFDVETVPTGWSVLSPPPTP